MKEQRIQVRTTDDIPSDWTVKVVRKKTKVKIRPVNPVKPERIKVSWSDSEMVCDPEKDIIVYNEAGEEWPCKIDIFADTYMAHIDVNACCPETGKPWDGNTWVKKASWGIVEIPESFVVDVHSLEGVLEDVRNPDHIAVGAKGELYVNTKEFIDKELEVISSTTKIK